MLNLLKFKKFADYGDATDKTLSGSEAYMRYAVEVAKLIDNTGGKIVFEGVTNTLVIGNGELEWDVVGLVEYPTTDAFLNMIATEEYQKIHIHRDAGLEHQLLV